MTTSPSSVTITPDPVAEPDDEAALISTMLGLTALATPATVPLREAYTTSVSAAEDAVTPVAEPPVSSCTP